MPFLRHRICCVSLLLACVFAWSGATGLRAGERHPVMDETQILDMLKKRLPKGVTITKDELPRTEDGSVDFKKLRALIERKQKEAEAQQKPPAPAEPPAPGLDYARIASLVGRDEEEKKEVYYHRCQHISSSELKRILENFITPRGTVANSDESHIVVVSDTASQLKVLKNIAETIDTPVPQVLVQAQIVELTLDSDFEKEIKVEFQHLSPHENAFIDKIVSTITTPGANPKAEQGGQFFFRPYVRNYEESGKKNILTSFLRYLETKGRAKILSAPNLILRRGVEGSIITGEEVPILQQTVVSGSLSTSTVFKRVGIKLRVNPIMITGTRVRLSIQPEVSTVTGFSSTGQAGVSNPIIAVRNANTELDVHHGELISIGGLYKSEKREVRSRVPIAGSLPVVGHFFRSTRLESIKTQLVIFLTITVLKDEPGRPPLVYAPSAIPEGVQQETERMETEMAPRPRAQLLQDLKRFIHEDSGQRQ